MSAEPQLWIPPADAVTDGFDRAAATYLRHATVQHALAAWLAEWLPVDRRGKAIEIGAGPGVFTRHLLPWQGSLLATDQSARMCATGTFHLPTVAWRVMSADAPTGGLWDWIFSSSMLQWVNDPTGVFRAWRQHLGANGRVLAGLFVAETLPELRGLIGAALPLRFRSADEWRAALARAGLVVCRDATESRRFEYSSAHAFIRTLHGVGAAPQRRLSYGRMRRLLRDYDRLHATNTGVFATWTFYRFEAVSSGGDGAPSSKQI